MLVSGSVFGFTFSSGPEATVSRAYGLGVGALDFVSSLFWRFRVCSREARAGGILYGLK